MPNKHVFVSAMYDVQIEPTLADRPHFPFAVTTRNHSIYYLLYYSIDYIPCPIGKVLTQGVFSCEPHPGNATTCRVTRAS